MEHMGYKMDSPIAVGEKDDKMSYPSLCIRNNIPSSLKDKKVGDMCKLNIVGKIVSMSESEHGEEMTIEVHKLEYAGKDKKEYDSMSEDDKDKADEEEVMEEEE